MPISLTITAESIDEFDALATRFFNYDPVTPGVAPAQDTAKQAPARRGARKAVEATTSTQEVGEVLSASSIAPTPSASAPESEVDNTAGNAPADTASAAAAAITASDDPTMQQLKDAMSTLIKAKSASVAMQTLTEATGCKSLTSGSPSVAEKSAEDPGIMKRAHDALVAAAL